MSKVALFETLLGILAFPWQHIHFVLRRPRDRPLSLVDRALATPNSLLLSQSSREGFESSLSVICDTLRVCFAGQVAKSANKMGVFACIPRDLTHLRTSLHTKRGGEKNCTNSHKKSSFFVAVGAIFFHRPLAWRKSSDIWLFSSTI